MKKILYFLGALLLLQSCKKDTVSNSYLRGKIGGVSFECNANISATAGGAGDKIIFLRGDWSNSSGIRFYLDGQGSNITTGSYDFQTGKIYNASLYENNDGYGAGYFCGFASPCSFYGSGKINFLEISKKHIKGTFEFVTNYGASSMSKIVSDGEFYIKRN